MTTNKNVRYNPWVREKILRDRSKLIDSLGLPIMFKGLPLKKCQKCGKNWSVDGELCPSCIKYETVRIAEVKKRMTWNREQGGECSGYHSSVSYRKYRKLPEY
jgi:predicted amidophosphoribosyltransferase